MSRSQGFVGMGDSEAHSDIPSFGKCQVLIQKIVILVYKIYEIKYFMGPIRGCVSYATELRGCVSCATVLTRYK